MFLKILTIFMSLFLLSSCATVEAPAQHSLSSSITPGTLHMVQSGETLWRISQKYKVDLDDILKANKISDSASIAAGQAIVIPSAEHVAVVATTNFGPKETSNDFIWPVKGKVITSYRQKYDGVFSKGIDIQTQGPQDFVASRRGKVVFADSLTGYGKMIVIDHEDGYSSVYSGDSSVMVKKDDTVSQGTVIGKTGDPLKKGFHCLHFEIRKKHKPQNPIFYLSD